MISFVLLKEASFAFIMDAKQVEYGTISLAGQSSIVTIGPDGLYMVKIYIYNMYYHILSSITYISREHWDLVSIIDVQSMVFANDRIHYGL